jgi:signal transduction histidine kinase
MPVPSPRKTLLLLWGTAAIVLAGGILLSRQERQIRLERDRAPLRAFAAEAQARLQRLEDLYQDHLVRLGREVIPKPLEAGKAADEITGILQISLLPSASSGVPPFHTLVNASPDGAVPLPAFSAAADMQDAKVPLVLLEEARLFSRDSGWIDEPGKPLMFSVRRGQAEVTVITVSRPMVARTIGNWLRTWAVKSFEPVRVTGGPDQFQAGGEVLAEVGIPASGQPPDLILPLRSRFGAFELASWNVRKSEVRYHTATLAITVTLAAAIAVLGVIVFLTQRREEAIAARRVSFVNRVSHELRTPLTNILLNIDLAGELAEDEPDESKRRLELVRIEARRLGRLIENVLSFSCAEEGKMEFQPRPCIPAGIVTSVIDSFLASFERRGLRIERADENTTTACVCDADAVTQILGNLLSNVEKYVPGGVVGISTKVSGDEWSIRVTDEGPGIPGEAAEKIFLPFERIHSVVNEGASGTGLGLSIARDLARRLGGDLKLLPSRPEGGACFELRIPVNPTPPST